MTALPLLHIPRRSRAVASVAKPLPRKDFGAIPVCGSVRPLASQQARAQRWD
jgi:hypothetical protein